MAKKRIEFTTRKTPRGCTVTMTWPSGRVRTKRFRDGYAYSEISAMRWIRYQIDVIEEMSHLGGNEMPGVFINDEEVAK